MNRSVSPNTVEPHSAPSRLQRLVQFVRDELFPRKRAREPTVFSVENDDFSDHIAEKRRRLSIQQSNTLKQYIPRRSVDYGSNGTRYESLVNQLVEEDDAKNNMERRITIADELAVPVRLDKFESPIPDMDVVRRQSTAMVERFQGTSDEESSSDQVEFAPLYTDDEGNLVRPPFINLDPRERYQLLQLKREMELARRMQRSLKYSVDPNETQSRPVSATAVETATQTYDVHYLRNKLNLSSSTKRNSAKPKNSAGYFSGDFAYDVDTSTDTQQKSLSGYLGEVSKPKFAHKNGHSTEKVSLTVDEDYLAKAESVADIIKVKEPTSSAKAVEPSTAFKFNINKNDINDLMNKRKQDNQLAQKAKRRLSDDATPAPSKLDEKPVFSLGSKDSKPAFSFNPSKSEEPAKPSFGLPKSAPNGDSKLPSLFGASESSDKPAFSFGASTSKSEAPSLFGEPAAKKEKPSLFAADTKPSSTDDKPPSLFSATNAKPAFSFGKTEDKKETPSFSFGAKPEEKKPALTLGADAKTDKPAFSFGAKPAADDKKPAFSFGAQGKTDKPALSFGSKEATPNLFGTPEPKETAPSEGTTKPVLSFGSKPQDPTSEAKPAFNFGKSEKPAFSFTPSDKASSEEPAAKFAGVAEKPAAKEGGFTFGAGTPDPSAKPTVSFGSGSTTPATKPFTFGEPSSTKEGSQGPDFKFGEKPEKPGFAFGQSNDGSKPSFNFGAVEKPSFNFGAVTKPSFNFGVTTAPAFGGAPQPEPQQNSGFNFGGTPPAFGKDSTPFANNNGFQFANGVTPMKPMANDPFNKETTPFGFSRSNTGTPEFNGAQPAFGGKPRKFAQMRRRRGM